MTPKYKRILLKLSGEALMGSDPYGINRQTIEEIVAEIAQVAAMGVEVGVVLNHHNTIPLFHQSLEYQTPDEVYFSSERQGFQSVGQAA